jgi:hypothetical protein
MEKFDTKNTAAATAFEIVDFDVQAVESEDTVGLPELAASIGEIGCCTITIKPNAM